MKKDLYPGIRERLSDQADDAFVILEEKLVGYDTLPVVGNVELLVTAEQFGTERVANPVLLADHNQFPGGGGIPLAQKEGDRLLEALRAEVDQTGLVDSERVELVLVEPFGLRAPAASGRLHPAKLQQRQRQQSRRQMSVAPRRAALTGCDRRLPTDRVVNASAKNGRETGSNPRLCRHNQEIVEKINEVCH